MCPAVAAVHAGAAIHCWPNPTAALAEISRVLRPGGVFVASTFLNFTAPLGALVGDEMVQPLNLVGGRWGGDSFLAGESGGGDLPYLVAPAEAASRQIWSSAPAGFPHPCPAAATTPPPLPRLQLEPNPRAYKWWQEQELKDLCNTVGLLDFRRARSNRFILFSATKPAGNAQ